MLCVFPLWAVGPETAPPRRRGLATPSISHRVARTFFLDESYSLV